MKPGDIITTTANNNSHFTHTGLVVNERGELKVVHNAPGNLNRYGGTIAVDSIEDYLAGRDIISTEPSGLSDEQIMAGVESCRSKRFDLLSFNCEHFVSLLTRGSPRSPQLAQFIRLTGMGAVAPALIWLGIRRRQPWLWITGIAIIAWNGYHYMTTDLQTSTGLGDTVKNLIDNVTLGKLNKSCQPCAARQQQLNQWLPYHGINGISLKMFEKNSSQKSS